MKTQKRVNRTAVFVSLLLCGIVVFWGIRVSAEEWTDAQKEVWKSVEASWERLIKGDLEAISGNYIEGFLTWWPSQPDPFSSDTMRAKYNGWFNFNKPVSYELKPTAIKIFGDTAIVLYQYKWTGNKSPDAARGRAFWSYVRQDGKWKYLGSMSCSCDKTPYCF